MSALPKAMNDAAPRPLSDAKRRLLEQYLRGTAPGPSAGRVIPRRPPGTHAPLSSGQHQIWLHCQLAPDSALYNEPLTVHRMGSLDVAALEWSLREIIRRHEAWRTTIAVVDGEPVQVVEPPPEIRLPVADLRGLPEPEREARARALATEDARRPFDLARGPLLRFRLVQLRDLEHRLYVTLHQIIFDGVSMYRVFLPELTALYEARVAGRPSPGADPEIQYGDFAWWQRRRLAEDTADDRMEYWRRQLAGAPTVLELPADRPRPSAQTFGGEQLTFALPPGLSDELKALGRGHGATLFMTLLAAWSVLLYRYTGQDDILVGTVAARRYPPELESLLGFFLNTLVLRARLADALSFQDLLRNVRETTLEALSHADVPIEHVVKSHKPDRDPSRNPLFQVMFVLEPPLPKPRPGWNLTQMDIDPGIARVDLYLEADDRPEGIVGRVRYRTDLFDRTTIVRLLERFQVLLKSIVVRPEQPISALPVLIPAERGQALRPREAVRVGHPFVAFPHEDVEQSIADRFATQVARFRRRSAVRDEARTWTYGALDDVAERVAVALGDVGGESQARIALLLDHDGMMVASVLGVLKAGLTYVPLDPSHPAERLSWILSDSGASAILTNGRNLELAHALADGVKRLINVDNLPKVPWAMPARRPVPPDHPAYILYTSGSTGRPKGIVQNHRNVLHFIRAYTNNLHIAAEDRLTLLSSYSVDAAVMDMFGALLNGAELWPIDVRKVGLVGLRERLRAFGLTVYHSTPTLYRHLLATSDGQELAPRLRLVVLGGEEVRREDVVAYRSQLPQGCLLVNGLGPTESTLALQQIIGRGTSVERPSVPAGFPVDDTEVMLLSAHGEPGQLYGEIAIRSRHIALGYWQQPELTRSVFLPDPEGGDRRIYRTGDMGRLLSDGSIEFAGRRDSQVKIRGFRIELGEVEATLARHPDVLEAAVVVTPHASGEPRLVAYWVAASSTKQEGAAPHPPETPPPLRRSLPPNGGESGSAASLVLQQGKAASLRRFLQEKLPDYMVPSTFVALKSLPLTPSGKLDRRALPEPEALPLAGPGSFEPPADAIELRLAGLWEQLLEAGPVGRRDNFFDLGGHSLLAVRLFAEAEKAFGLRIPLATLFAAPTIEQLAAVFREKTRTPSACLVKLQPGGTRPPFFGVHGHSGEVLFYRELASALGPDQPFFALQAHGLDGQPALRSVETMALRYLEELRAVQPRGPYFIGGYCLGAIIAFEMAQQIVAQGDEVGVLALFLGYVAPLRPGARTIRVLRLGERLWSHLRRARAEKGAARVAYVLGKSGGVSRNLTRRLGKVLWRLAYGLLGRAARAPRFLLRNVEEMNLWAARRYVPRRYPGRMTVLLSGDTPPGFTPDPARDLDGLRAAEVDLVSVPGVSDTMMKEPHVSVLAARLKTRLG